MVKYFLEKKIQKMIYVLSSWKAKMEAGENPARSRHCIDGVLPGIH